MEFDGRTYICRIVSIDGENLLIGSTKLLDALHPHEYGTENDGFAGKKAEDLYDEIFFFTDADTLLFPDEELMKELKQDNPEWF